MRCSSLSSTSSAKSTPVAAAIARTASWTGLPSTTPNVARGSPIRRASWRASTVSSPASPGATILGPPLNPAKKCGSTNPVVRRTSASTHSRFSRTGTSPTIPRSTRDRSVPGVMVHDPEGPDDVGAEHRDPLVGGARPMRARRDEDHHVLRPDDAIAHLEDGLQHRAAGLRTGHVADRDRHGLAGSRGASRSGGPATGSRSAVRRVAARIWRGRPMRRRDDRRALGGHIDRRARRARRRAGPVAGGSRSIRHDSADVAQPPDALDVHDDLLAILAGSAAAPGTRRHRPASRSR